ncbi:MAG: hypothetical protein PVG45_12235, partial [Gammaproteobacteria bacterium]
MLSMPRAQRSMLRHHAARTPMTDMISMSLRCTEAEGTRFSYPDQKITLLYFGKPRRDGFFIRARSQRYVM